MRVRYSWLVARPIQLQEVEFAQGRRGVQFGGLIVGVSLQLIDSIFHWSHTLDSKVAQMGAMLILVPYIIGFQFTRR